MKRFLIFLVVLAVITSCSKNDTALNSNSINPPEWIHGTWEAEGAMGNSSSGIRFTSNDVVLITGFSELSHKNQIESYSDIMEMTVEETKSDEEYHLTISSSQGIATNYAFRKKDENSLYWENTGYGTLELTRQ